MAGTADSSGGPVSPLVALGLATVSFVALLIFGLGMTSLALNIDIVATPGLGQVPAIVATALTVVAFGLSLWLALRRQHPSYWNALWTALACVLVYIGALWLGALIAGADLAVAASVAGRIATTWFGVVIAATAAIAAWGGIALVRTRSQRPRWPWEDEFDE